VIIVTPVGKQPMSCRYSFFVNAIIVPFLRDVQPAPTARNLPHP
jgi:hypothetical protein